MNPTINMDTNLDELSHDPIFTLTAAEMLLPPAGAADGPVVYRASDLLPALERDFRRRQQSQDPFNPAGICFPFPKLNNALGGLLEAGLHFLHGNPGAGKTAFFLQTACEADAPVLYITCEMSPETLIKRAVACLTGTYMNQIHSPDQSIETVMAICHEATEKMSHMRIYDASRWGVTLQEIETALVSMAPQDGKCLIVVDSVHSWADQFDSGTEYERLNAAIQGLQRLARKYNCPILGICERNRSSMATAGLSAGAGSRKLEYSAETVLSLQADGKESDRDGWRKITVTIEKNRWGASSEKFHLQFHGALQTFREEN